MKLCNKQGKIFGKIHIIDMIFIVLVVVLIFSVINKFAGSNVKVFNGTSQKAKVEMTLETYAYREEYLKSLSIGDKIAEDKSYLNGEIKKIEIVDNMIAKSDNNGNIVVGAHPFTKKARVLVNVEVDIKGNKIKMGKKELIVGKSMFLTTTKANLSTKIMDIKEIME
ncbi:MAG: DUF4330 domain-containing protein [Vallitalea sp.]|jgi:hypothetical protein|nr:DUF4330 domain-containing protein [Vallitalea sp.]